MSHTFDAKIKFRLNTNLHLIYFSGLLYIILQITLCDIGLLLIAPLETFYTSHQYWTFPPELCSLYMGVESFAATAIFYFIIACNFHSITTYNLAINEYHRLEKVDEETSSEPTTLFDTDNQDENNDDDDNHDVDSNNDNYEIALRDHKRSLTIDYRKRKYSISVILPVLFIWFLAASVSFPLFMFSTVIPNEKFPKICGIINFNNENNLLMRYLILIVKIVIPTFGLTATMISVGVKLFTRKMEFRKCEIEESVYDILKISFIMSLTFCLLSMQRFYGSLYFEISHKPFTSHKYPTMNALSALVLVFLFYGNSFVRPIIYWVIDGLLWRKVKEILMCKFRKK